MTEDTSNDAPLREISLRQVLERAPAGCRTPAAFSIIAVILAIIDLSLTTPRFLVEMSVMPAPSSQAETGMTPSGGMSALLGIIGGTEVNTSYGRYQKLLTSTAVADRLQKKYGTLQAVFSDQWDEKEKKWVKPAKLRYTLFGWLFNLARVPVWTPPDTTDLAAYLEDTIIIVPAVKSDIVALSVRDKDPVFARHLLTWAHIEANDVLRDQVATRAGQQVAYLQRKLSQTTVEDYRQTLLSLLSAQEKTLMLTQTSAPYAAEILNPPTSSMRPVSPRPALSIVVAILVGVLIGLSVIIFFGPDWWQRFRKRLDPIRTALARRRRES